MRVFHSSYKQEGNFQWGRRKNRQHKRQTKLIFNVQMTLQMVSLINLEIICICDTVLVLKDLDVRVGLQYFSHMSPGVALPP